MSFFFVFVSFKSFPLSYSTLFTFLFFFLVLFFSYSTRKSWRMKKRQDTGNSWESKWCRVQYRSLTAGPLRTAMSDSTRYWAVGATYTQAYFARLTISYFNTSLKCISVGWHPLIDSSTCPWKLLHWKNKRKQQVMGKCFVFVLFLFCYCCWISCY